MQLAFPKEVLLMFLNRVSAGACLATITVMDGEVLANMYFQPANGSSGKITYCTFIAWKNVLHHLRTGFT